MRCFRRQKKIHLMLLFLKSRNFFEAEIRRSFTFTKCKNYNWEGESDGSRDLRGEIVWWFRGSFVWLTSSSEERDKNGIFYLRVFAVERETKKGKSYKLGTISKVIKAACSMRRRKMDWGWSYLIRYSKSNWTLALAFLFIVSSTLNFRWIFFHRKSHSSSEAWLNFTTQFNMKNSAHSAAVAQGLLHLIFHHIFQLLRLPQLPREMLYEKIFSHPLSSEK